jgi:hypothetical protein
MFTHLEDFGADVEINSAWKMIRENIKMSPKESLCYFDLKKHKPCFDGGRLKLLHQRKQAKLHWLQDSSEINGDNLNNIKYEVSRHFWNEKKEYLNYKVSELAMNSKNKNSKDLCREQINIRGGINREITS